MKRWIKILLLVFHVLICCQVGHTQTSISSNVIWTSDHEYSNGVNLQQAGSLTIKNGATVIINGNLKINGVLTVEAGAKLIVDGNISTERDLARIVSLGDIQVSGYASFDKGEVELLGTTSIGGDCYCNATSKMTFGGVSVEIGGSFFEGGRVTDATYTNRYASSTISSGTRVYVAGNLTNYGTIDMEGRLVVGSGSYIEGRYIIDPESGTGTVTNSGQIDIKTPSDKRNKAKTNSELYAALTARNVVSTGYIDEYEGFLIVQNDMTFSKGVYFDEGHSYVYVWNDMHQEKGSAIGTASLSGPEVTIMVGNTYYDNTTFDWVSTTRSGYTTTYNLSHWWYMERQCTGATCYGTDGAFTIEPNTELIVDSYVMNGTNKSGLVHSKDVSFLKDQKNKAQNWIEAANDTIETARSKIADLTGPNGKDYKKIIETYPEEVAATMLSERIAEQESIIATQERNISIRTEQIEYSDILIGYISNYDNQYGATFKSWKAKFDAWFNTPHYSSNGDGFAWGQVKKASGIRNLLLDYIKQYGINAGDYEDVAKKISVMLPIELSYFNVTQEGSFVVFEWTTETETNNDFFTVEYSIDGVQYNALTNVEGAGTSTEKLMYSADAEADMFDGIVYFRLKQTDFNGESTYSDVKAIDIQGENAEFVVYPNPATNEITIEGGEYAKVYFVDMQSKTYSAEQIGENQYSVENLPNGLNFVVIETARGPILKKIMIVRDSAFEK